ncbi:hypothetical protein [Paraburkholderia caballeronis]|uniref:Uncharacterized protein n=1 Tax=Paraburkholderia caballeronis TaxID=416943 RepID=A0A1H7UMQ1_9BURK|nr:hypothetical protein [Paraburkholderia caballeronis]PXW26593.1 hypothetical protein C7403_104474 [Paraburkholderia caballeronis]PXX02139.1 hypothetical protein C7407_104473 [Paraburkholderia caballeronis]RAK01296.1 hypothetical protein C7409_104473 [Paraburkholderia caballeronis]TDV25952.1 hypothetical protein C7405_12184 [Paraburkholderia caballeronis]SEB86677.1 hypothetical protein SAMN05445871_1220 [Paraburkholderia caballeronis]
MRSVSQLARRLFAVRRTALAAALLPATLAAALLVAAPGAHAQANDAPRAAQTDEAVARSGDAPTDSADAISDRRRIASDTPHGDDTVAGVGQLDDQTLSRQRGGAVGMVMVAATPQLMRGNGVTLWDEIAPPMPLPVPIDASQAAQGNIASYTRR